MQVVLSVFADHGILLRWWIFPCCKTLALFKFNVPGMNSQMARFYFRRNTWAQKC